MSVIRTNMTPEQEKVALENWRPPDPHKLRYKQRVFSLERWVESQGFVTDEQLIAQAMMRFKVSREQAKKYLKSVVEDFKKAGVPVIK